MTESPESLKYAGMTCNQQGKRIFHYEHWSCPDAETYLSGVDAYEKPRTCREIINQKYYPFFGLWAHGDDTPIPRPKLDLGDNTSTEHHTVRWDKGETATWEHGEAIFKTAEEALKFSPLEHADMRGWSHVVAAFDYTSEETLYNTFRTWFPAEWEDTAPEGSAAEFGFYNTTFMWPMLTFGWEIFLEICLEPEFERIMDEFAELNRRLFRAAARLPAKFVTCHDDIFTSRGPVCSPSWMKKYVWPRYEEYWEILNKAGKSPIFMADGCADQYADDIVACGAKGIITEPYTDFKKIARKHPDIFIAGEGDNRVLSRSNPDEIKQMVLSMVDTAQVAGGYAMCIGNHIPWNVPPKSIELYLELSREYGYKK